jgi:hypothetical protein
MADQNQPFYELKGYRAMKFKSLAFAGPAILSHLVVHNAGR